MFTDVDPAAALLHLFSSDWTHVDHDPEDVGGACHLPQHPRHTHSRVWNIPQGIQVYSRFPVDHQYFYNRLLALYVLYNVSMIYGSWSL